MVMAARVKIQSAEGLGREGWSCAKEHVIRGSVGLSRSPRVNTCPVCIHFHATPSRISKALDNMFSCVELHSAGIRRPQLPLIAPR